MRPAWRGAALAVALVGPWRVARAQLTEGWPGVATGDLLRVTAAAPRGGDAQFAGRLARTDSLGLTLRMASEGNLAWDRAEALGFRVVSPRVERDSIEVAVPWDALRAAERGTPAVKDALARGWRGAVVGSAVGAVFGWAHAAAHKQTYDPSCCSPVYLRIATGTRSDIAPADSPDTGHAATVGAVVGALLGAWIAVGLGDDVDWSAVAIPARR